MFQNQWSCKIILSKLSQESIYIHLEVKRSSRDYLSMLDVINSKKCNQEMLFNCFSVVSWAGANSFSFHITLTHLSILRCLFLIRFVSHFWPKINKQGERWGGFNKNVLECIFKNIMVALGECLFRIREYWWSSFYHYFWKLIFNSNFSWQSS